MVFEPVLHREPAFLLLRCVLCFVEQLVQFHVQCYSWVHVIWRLSHSRYFLCKSKSSSYFLNCLEPISAIIGREAECPLDRSPAHRRADTQRQTTLHTYGQFRVTNEPNTQVSGGSWRTWRENPNHSAAGTTQFYTERFYLVWVRVLTQTILPLLVWVILKSWNKVNYLSSLTWGWKSVWGRNIVWGQKHNSCEILSVSLSWITK